MKGFQSLAASFCLLGAGWCITAGFGIPAAAREEPPARQRLAQASERTLSFPILRTGGDTFTSFAFLNLGKEAATLTPKAYSETGIELGGPGVNPSSRTLLPSQQLPLLAPEIFNFASPSNEGWMEVQSDKNTVVGFQLIGDNTLNVLDGIAAPLAASSLVLTDIEYDSVYSTEVHLANTAGAQNNLTLELYSGAGVQAGRFSTSLPAKGKYFGKIQDIFPSMPRPFLGYLVVRGDQDVAAAELLVSSSAMAALGGQRLQAASVTPTKLYSAQLGNRRNSVFTKLNLVNPTARAANLVLRASDDNGSNLGSSPRNITLAPGQQDRRDAGELFELAPDKTTSGSLVIESDIAGIVGDISFGDDSGANAFRASLPLDSQLSTFAAFGHVANSGVFLTGAAALNPNPQPANVTVTVFRANGSQVGSTTQRLGPNGRFSKLLFPELVILSAGQAGGFFTLESDRPISSFALFGALKGGAFSALSAIPPQRLETATSDNPVPTAGSLSPASATAGGAAFTLTVTGTNFVSGSVVRWNGADRTTTFVSSTQLTVAITAADIAQGGSASVTVFNPAPGGGTSGTLAFSIIASANPVPTLSSLSPSSAIAGAVAFTLTVDGTNFVAGSKVRWNGSDRTTTFVNSTRLTAAVSASDVAQAGTANVTVFNPTPGGGTSSALVFTVNAAANPVPSLSALNPSSVTAGGASFTLTVTGTNFVSGSKVRWNGTDRTTTFVSSTQLTAAIPAADIALAGTASVTVFNPSPGGGSSSSLTFTINPAASTSATLKADYRLQNSLASSVAGAPALTNLGSNVFGTATVDGTSRTVLNFARNDGLSLSPTTGVIPGGTYTAVILFSFKETAGYQRILEFKNGTGDTGLYDHDGHLHFWNIGAEDPAALIAASNFVQVALTRDAGKKVTGYVNGGKSFEFVDSGDLAVVDAGNTLRFFQDNLSNGTTNEASAGSVVRIRLYDGALSTAEIAALDRLPVGTEGIGANLLRNPGGEEGQGSPSDGVVPLPGWTTTSNFTAVLYGTPNSPTIAESQRIDGGLNFFAGGPNNALSTAAQVVDLSGRATDIDAGKQTALLRAQLTGYGDGDNSAVKADFLGSGGAVLGSLSIGPVAGPSNSFQLRETSGAVPAGTRSVRVTMTSVRNGGSYNDGYFDNIFFGISQGSTAPTPAIDLAATSLDFGSVAVGSNKDLTVTIGNRGTAVLTVNSIASSNAQFTVVSPDTPFNVVAASVLGPGQQNLTVRFTPASTGNQTGTLTINSNDPSRPSVTLSVLGSGATAATPSIDVAPSSLDFGTVSVGQVKDLTLTVRNTGDAALTVSSIASNNSQFTITSPAIPFTVAASGQQAVTVRFAAVSTGIQSGTLTVASSDSSRPSVAVSLSGSGATAAAPKLEVTPSSLDFGTTNVGESKDLTFTARNSGTGTLTISSITSNNARFTVTSPSLPFSLAAGAQQTVTVRFAPTAGGAQSGTLTIASNDPAGVSVSISGTGNAGTAPTIGNITVTPNRSTNDSAVIDLQLSDPDGDVVRIDYTFSRTGVSQPTRTISSPTDFNLAGFTFGTVTQTFNGIGITTPFGLVLPDRVEIEATDAKGLKSGKVSKNF